MSMFPNFFSGESGSLMSLFFLALFVFVHLVSTRERRHFVRDYGANAYAMMRPDRALSARGAIIAYVVVSLVLAGAVNGEPTVFGLVVWLYGFRVAGAVGDTSLISEVRQRQADEAAANNFRQEQRGLTTPPVERFQSSAMVTTLPHDESFAFDADRFKR